MALLDNGNLLYLDEDSLRAALSLTAAIDALEGTLRDDPLPEAPVRSHHRALRGELLIMPAWGAPGVGVKLMTVNGDNPSEGLPLLHGVFVLFDPEHGKPEVAIDGAALTSLRTAAVSALATRHLACDDAEELCIFGAGRQAHAHVEAMLAVRSIKTVTVVDFNEDRTASLLALADELGLSGRAGERADVATAQLVCCCTTSLQPVFDGSLLQPGTHVNAMGAYRPDMRELDPEALKRSRVVVEERDAALAEAGDLLIAIDEGEFSPTDICADLTEVVRGAPARRGAEDITVFKSVGLALEDLVVARAALAAIAG